MENGSLKTLKLWEENRWDGLKTVTDDKIADIICNKLKLGNLLILENPSNSNSPTISSEGCNCN